MSHIDRDLWQDDTLRFRMGYMVEKKGTADMSKINFIYAGCLEVNVSTHRREIRLWFKLLSVEVCEQG